MRKIICSILLFVSLLSLTNTAEQNYQKVIHDYDPEAKCLDGSSPALYVHEGSDKNSILIYFFGGGSCAALTLQETIQNCYQRSKTELGGSKLLPDTYIGAGYLSTDSQISKFANWTKILLSYCDGSFHQGSTKTPVKYKDASLYFRGADIVRSHFRWIGANYNLAKAEKVMITGSAEGGVASFLWLNYLRSLVENPPIVYCVADSALLMNVNSVASGQQNLDISFQNLFKLSNLDEKTPVPNCNRFKLGQEHKCLFLQSIFTSIQGKMLIVNSQYDTWMISNGLEINCIKQGTEGDTLSGCTNSQLAYIQSYRRSYINDVNNHLQFSKNSAWSIACAYHVYANNQRYYSSPNHRVPQSEGLTVQTAIERFVINGQRVSTIDQEPWPYNRPCST